MHKIINSTNNIKGLHTIKKARTTKKKSKKGRKNNRKIYREREQYKNTTYVMWYAIFFKNRPDFMGLIL